MNRQKLTELVSFPERISSRDTAMLEEMAAQYPYATVIQILLGKSKQKQADARHGLATAALYTPNRHILRLVMEDQLPQLPGRDLPPVAHQQSVNEQQEPEQSPEPENDIFDELQQNLKKLRDERRKMYAQQQIPSPEATSQVQDDVAAKDTGLAGMHPALEQIVEEHEQQNLDNPRVRQQRSLIDSFLENASSLPRRQPQAATPGDEITDLSQRMALAPQDLATETLALIMEKQGKTEKAIDIYQKLILKYPQKSAYFADCIERLKKEI